MVGTLIVFICFLCVFAIDPIPADQVNAKVVYYSIAASLFNIGWATVQISHLAMIPDLAKDDYQLTFFLCAIFGYLRHPAKFLIYTLGMSFTAGMLDMFPRK